MAWDLSSTPCTTSSAPATARRIFRPLNGPDSTRLKTSAIGLAFALAALVLAVLILRRRNLSARATTNVHRPVPNMASAVVVNRRGLHVPPGAPPPDPRPKVHLGQVVVEDHPNHVRLDLARDLTTGRPLRDERRSHVEPVVHVHHDLRVVPGVPDLPRLVDASTLSVALASALHAHQGSPQNGKGVVPGCVGTYSVYPRERGYVLGPQAVTSHVSREERPAIRSQRSIWSGVRVTPPEAASLDQATVSSPALDCE